MKAKAATTRNKKNSTSISYAGRSAFVAGLVKRGTRKFDVVLEKTRARFPHSGKNRVKALFTRAVRETAHAE